MSSFTTQPIDRYLSDSQIKKYKLENHFVTYDLRGGDLFILDGNKEETLLLLVKRGDKYIIQHI